MTLSTPAPLPRTDSSSTGPHTYPDKSEGKRGFVLVEFSILGCGPVLLFYEAECAWQGGLSRGCQGRLLAL